VLAVAQTSGIYEHGKVILDNPVDWPEGTHVNVICGVSSNGTTDVRVDGVPWDDSQEGINNWITWLDSRQPVLTGEELARFEADLRANREREKVNSSTWVRRIDKLQM
jgi:hypothetical protein